MAVPTATELGELFFGDGRRQAALLKYYAARWQLKKKSPSSGVCRK
jgi:hypothetical protein